MLPDLSPAGLVLAYSHGIFPMGDEEGQLMWLSPDPRAILELDQVKIPRSLRMVVRRGTFDITFDQAFCDVVAGCADREGGTWITPQIVEAYSSLFRLGLAHSLEAWQGGELAGGLYGVTLGAAFFGESMFHRVTDASKVALVHLVQRLKLQQFTLLDLQFSTDHLRRFGAVEIPRMVYLQRVREAVRTARSFEPGSEPLDLLQALRRAEGAS